MKGLIGDRGQVIQLRLRVRLEAGSWTKTEMGFSSSRSLLMFEFWRRLGDAWSWISTLRNGASERTTTAWPWRSLMDSDFSEYWCLWSCDHHRPLELDYGYPTDYETNYKLWTEKIFRPAIGPLNFSHPQSHCAICTYLEAVRAVSLYDFGMKNFNWWIGCTKLHGCLPTQYFLVLISNADWEICKIMGLTV